MDVLSSEYWTIYFAHLLAELYFQIAFPSVRVQGGMYVYEALITRILENTQSRELTKVTQ